MENLIVPVHLKDHNYWRRITACQASGPKQTRACSKQLCCRKDQVTNSTLRPRCSEKTFSLPRKRKRSSASRSSRPLVHRSTISPDDLPVASKMPPRCQPCTTNKQLPSSGDSHIQVHNTTEEDYRRVCHEVVENMLKYKNGRPRHYTVELGRCVKQKLWERLNRPRVETSSNEDGLEKIDMIYGRGVNAPHYDF